ncbi:MAG: Spo0B domain-containing protein [Lachnospiraceae bacterium]|nr:Spo0B domain-containing protein [Lachnospiraceae bacterium]
MDNSRLYLTLCVILVFVLLAAIALLIRSYNRLIKRSETLEDTIDNLGKLNDKLRIDRHDYLNQLQVVYGLMELGEYEEMNSYLKKIYKEFIKTGKAIKTSKPALNALLAAKNAEAEAKDMDFVIEVKSDLKALAVEDWCLCKVLSNLIDNAVSALEDSDRAGKRIRVDITESKEAYIFEVENNGPTIPEGIRDRIFKKGFSTKKGEDHGMGLAIVAEILAENAGSIDFESEEKETVFRVTFKKGET